MALFDNIKKIKLIKEINRVRDFRGFIDEEFFSKYDYNVISKLDSKDYVLLPKELGELLDLVSFLGKKLYNVDIFSFSFQQLKKFLKTKEDYFHLERLCSKYDIKTVEDYITSNEIIKITEVSLGKVEEFLKFKEFKSRLTGELPNSIKNYHEAVNYEKMSLLISEKGLNKDHFFEQYYKFNNFCSVINFDELSDNDKINLIDYFNFSFNSRLDIKLNSKEDLLNYDNIKQAAIDKYFAINLDTVAFFYMISNFNDCLDLNNILVQCSDLSKIYDLGTENLINKFGFSIKEVELIKILSQLQNDVNNLFELYKKYRDSGEHFKKINLFNFRNKLRNAYANEISTSLTKLDSDERKILLSETTSLGTEMYGVPVYEKTNGNFKFIVHSIIESHGVNTSIINANNANGQHLFTNPQLWDTLSPKTGTNTISASLISSEGTPFLYTESMSQTVVYGFDELDAQSVRNISYTDGATSHNVEGFEAYGGGRETMMFSDDLIDKANSSNRGYKYNEVAFNRYNADGTRKKPNFILCFDNVTEASVRHAQYHEVPILVIKTRKYLDNFEEKIVASGEMLKNCDKNNLTEYYIILKRYLKELLRYRRMPSCSSEIRMNIDLKHIDEIEIELDNVERKIRKNNYDEVNNISR